ncbi:thermonuclease family protein [Allochromatium palmeri]|uniref:Thermonuclease family protein n=1 Tax=Allochromatium palmeri TaxID=231048 RepID=A0A6N8EDJ1_9GAMM|nr:thermonuclease family protein [Allochromatium palmeri]MTW20979.1 thermonuclease family protein [Allochromatium palmeri]
MRLQTFLKHYLRSKLRNPGRLSARSVGGVALAVLGLWAVEHWGGDLIPNAWKLPLSGKDCRVEKISDGDTMRLRCGTQLVKVRLYCIDAPEMAQKPWGTRSRDALKSITPSEVRLLKIDQDQYGRTVGEIYTTDAEPRLLNLEQVENGQAAVYPQYCNSRRYFSAEREAQAAKRGIWSRRGTHQTPWDYRRRSRG